MLICCCIAHTMADCPSLTEYLIWCFIFFFNYTTSGYLYGPRVAIYIHIEHAIQSENRSKIHKQTAHTRYKSQILGVFPPFNKMTTFIYLNACISYIVLCFCDGIVYKQTLFISEMLWCTHRHTILFLSFVIHNIFCWYLVAYNVFWVHTFRDLAHGCHIKKKLNVISNSLSRELP